MKVAQHYNAYTAFDVVISDVRPGEHTLIVAADNRFSEASALHIPNDYYTYGGIIRPVILEELYSPYVRQLYFTPEHKSGVIPTSAPSTVISIPAESKAASSSWA
ncbi:hypothetical protein [Paenibacillus sp. AR247]|uniref:hypothetical protein n=1 Tax=Paenibacillus sp. AR247 TaxID=1631599 RepID=UPI000CF9290C|nr:hypothetical protein [Paenibacillus sp. AR247]PQP88704.1 hypothetical protein CPT76_10480 [Paenibacillus sp. AR247]